MIDRMTMLAFSLHYNKGVYALLLGSGISTSAEIFTGWQIVLDLTRKVARLRGEDCDADPAAWYASTFAGEPNYSKLLNELSNSQAERSQIIRGYIEPSEDEREQGFKVPTSAHNAIAELVASGHIRVIITTNFDHLLEQALHVAGVEPTIISNAGAVEGARPLQHTNCTIIKINGDYIDTRIRNTQDELNNYEESLRSLLARVFDEYGLIVCGWSADWDTALRDILERSPNHRFSTYWTVRGEPSTVAAKTIAFRKAEVIKIEDADTFFSEMAEKVVALDEMESPHPLSIRTAVQTVARYVVDPVYRVRLERLVMQETTNFNGLVTEDRFPIHSTPPLTGETLIGQLHSYETLIEKLQAMLVTGRCSRTKQQDRHHNLPHATGPPCE